MPPWESRKSCRVKVRVWQRLRKGFRGGEWQSSRKELGGRAGLVLHMLNPLNMPSMYTWA